MSERPASSRDSTAYPEELHARELEWLRSRRSAVGLSAPASAALAVGIGLSGGGIRSATFNLGVFQALARLRLLHRIDYVSTVSGGGYIGSFLGRLFTRDPIDAAEVERVLAQESRPEVLRHLRENGRYLSPQGAGDLLLDGAVLFRNWAALIVVIVVSLLAAFLSAEAIKRSAHYLTGPAYETVERGLNAVLPLGFSALWWSTWTALPLVLAVFTVLPLAIAYWLERWSASIVLLGALALCVLQNRPPVVHLTELLRLALFAVPLAAALFWWSAQRLASDQDVLAHDSGIRNRLSHWLKVALFSCCGLLLFAIVDSIGQTLYLAIAASIFDSWASWLGVSMAALMAGAGVARRITIAFARRPIGRRPALPAALLATLGALVATLALLVSVSTAAHAIARIDAPVRSPSPWLQIPEQERSVLFSGASMQLDAGVEVALVRDRQLASTVGWDRDLRVRDLYAPLIALVVALATCLIFGRAWRFLTRSSHHPLYSARLTRAYLGASNPQRLRHDISVTQVVPDDEIQLRDYFATEPIVEGALTPAQKGAPLHLINVTINETVDGRSHVQQQDRKGTGMAIGPCGLSVGVRHHAVLHWSDPAHARTFPPQATANTHRVFDPGQRAFEPEQLSLGQWVAISGAAFSTGLGARTSLGLSLLAGLTNIRLGYWWDAGLPRVTTALERVFPVQTYLLRELLARFSGTAGPRWYLSDGGHFENMGGYELIRRQQQRLIIIDAEADPEYTFQGLANLIRKARLDFGAEIRFLTERELDARVDKKMRRCFGTLEQLKRGNWTTAPRFGEDKIESLLAFAMHDDAGLSIAHAALAEVSYRGGAEPGLLLYVKPTLTGCEPADLTQYHAEHPPFPQETTADQFFDEAQWESYRKLGDCIATMLFAEVEGKGKAAEAGAPGAKSRGEKPWTPRDLLA